jgi:hypothetical protein
MPSPPTLFARPDFVRLLVFGMLKHEIKDWMFQTIEETVTNVKMTWEGLTLEDVHSVFFNWMERLEWVIEHEGEYCIK